MLLWTPTKPLKTFSEGWCLWSTPSIYRPKRPRATELLRCMERREKGLLGAMPGATGTDRPADVLHRPQRIRFVMVREGEVFIMLPRVMKWLSSAALLLMVMPVGLGGELSTAIHRCRVFGRHRRADAGDRRTGVLLGGGVHRGRPGLQSRGSLVSGGG
jgi:hypothetical protein